MITPAYAQGAEAAGGTALLLNLLPFILIFVIMWFLIIRPQRQRMKQHQEMLSNIRRGDNVVTNGGLIGKVTKAEDTELSLEIAEGVKVRVARSMIAEVRAKGEPVKDS